MNLIRYRGVLFLIALCGTASAVSSCTKKSTEINTDTAGSSRPQDSITPMEAAGLIRNDFAVIIDIRSKEETDAGYVDGSLFFTQADIENETQAFKDFLAAHDKNKQILFMAASEAPAKTLAKKIESQGFKTGYLPGFEAWRRVRLPYKARTAGGAAAPAAASEESEASGVAPPASPNPPGVEN